MKKYYFITYQGFNRDGSVQTWNQCIDTSPMAFIKELLKCEKDGSNHYLDFVVLNTCEITEKEFNKYKDEF